MNMIPHLLILHWLLWLLIFCLCYFLYLLDLIWWVIILRIFSIFFNIENMFENILSWFFRYFFYFFIYSSFITFWSQFLLFPLLLVLIFNFSSPMHSSISPQKRAGLQWISTKYDILSCSKTSPSPLIKAG